MQCLNCNFELQLKREWCYNDTLVYHTGMMHRYAALQSTYTARTPWVCTQTTTPCGMFIVSTCTNRPLQTRCMYWTVNQPPPCAASGTVMLVQRCHVCTAKHVAHPTA